MNIDHTNIKKYCPQCASVVTKKCPEGDNCVRTVCENCGHIDYENPKVLVACFVTYKDKLLWMRRKCEPMAGYWFIPAGYMELGETPEEAASRELFEETCAIVNPNKLNFYLIGSLPDISQIYLAYRGQLKNIESIQTTHESLDVGLFSKNEAPWSKIAFPSVEETFHLFYKDHSKKDYGVYRAQFSDNNHLIKTL